MSTSMKNTGYVRNVSRLMEVVAAPALGLLPLPSPAAFTHHHPFQAPASRVVLSAVTPAVMRLLPAPGNPKSPLPKPLRSLLSSSSPSAPHSDGLEPPLEPPSIVVGSLMLCWLWYA